MQDQAYHYYGDGNPDSEYGDGGSNYAVEVFEREGGGTTLSVVQVTTGLRKVFKTTTPFQQIVVFCNGMSPGAWASHFPSERRKKGKNK